MALLLLLLLLYYTCADCHDSADPDVPVDGWLLRQEYSSVD
jgi:hypothetical protein